MELVADARNFKEVHVGNFVHQSSDIRYPVTNDPDLDDDFLAQTVEHPPPRPMRADWRSNLVALSQKYNLYFAAYQDKVHATIPRNLKQKLPGASDLVLDLPRTQSGREAGGYINREFPHCVNHLKLGNLGNQEVLVAVCDDGDILVYYTSRIWHEINGFHFVKGEARVSGTEPYIHENVSISAWGIAIHEKSRLVAVSSNRREVTVFVPAYTPDNSTTEDTLSALDETISSTSLPSKTESVFFPPLDVDNVSVHFRRRSYRKILQLGREGHNIPSITFSNDKDGNAQSVLAADIRGNLWILGIWTGERECLPGIDPPGSVDDGRMGWGVLTLPLAIFKHASTPQEALGVPDLDKAVSLDGSRTRDPKRLDISTSVRHVRNSSLYHPNFGYGIAGPGTRWDADVGQPAESILSNDDESEDERYYDAQETFEQGRPPGQSVLDYAMNLGIDIDNFDGELFRSIEPLSDESLRDPSKRLQRQEWIMAMTANQTQNMDPRLVDAWRNKVFPTPRTQRVAKEIEKMKQATEAFRLLVNMPPSLREPTQSAYDLKSRLKQFTALGEFDIESALATEPANQRSQAFILPDQCAILRTYQFDIELMPPTNSMMRTVCTSMLKQRLTAAVAGLRPFERLNMLAVIDELSLLVIGTQVGRCALITPTRLPDDFSNNGPVVMFRIDRILPSKSQENEGVRPNAPLLGLAVSPLQTDESPCAKKRQCERAWRLVMHYYDHTILSYELRRNENDVLLIGKDADNVFKAI